MQKLILCLSFILFSKTICYAQFQIGVCDWSIQKKLSADSFEFARDCGLQGVQYSFDKPGEGLDLRLRENRDRIREIIKQTGVGITSLGIGRLNSIPLAATDEAEQLIVECLETMVKLKQEADLLDDRQLAKKASPDIVLLAFFGKGDINGKPELIAAVIEKLKRLAPMAEKHGLVMGIESLLSEKDHRFIIDSVGSPAVKVYYDTANSNKMGYDIYQEIESLGREHICEIHLKENGNLLSQGEIDFDRVKSILQSIEYKGWLIIEGSTPKGTSREQSCRQNAALAAELFNPKIPRELLGDWSLDLDSGEPAWMSVVEVDGRPKVYMRVYVGPDGPWDVTKIDKGRIWFAFKNRRKQKGKKVHMKSEVDVGLNKNGELTGKIVRSPSDGSGDGSVVQFTGEAIPPMPTTVPDLSEVEFGDPISLFNGKDLSGWRPHEADKINGWRVEDGLLVNATPKTDFSATGAHANLRTVDEFKDFRLHIEFLIGKDRNSGVYLRGMYEAQVVDRDSRMQGLQGVGAIFSRIAPLTNAGKVGGEWQSYEITLVDRHVTVTLNGVKTIDNQPIIGPTGGAICTNPMKPGPIYLQGDHTSVKYRNIYLEPVVTQELN